jgi:hypothetical protein
MGLHAIVRLGLALTALVCASGVTAEESDRPNRKNPYEVWLVDQANSRGLAYGGYIHIFDGESLTGGRPSDAEPADVIDLGADVAALCFASTGANPVRPHMLVFNSMDTHAALSFVASGHVVFFDARTRGPLACFRTEPGAGGARQAHAVWPTRDDEFMLVANQNGKKLERIRTNYRHNVFVQEPAATLNLATCITPNGLACQDAILRPDNAPICPFTASDNGPAFVSLRGGGMFVVDWRTAPMSIIGEYDRASVPANGCGFVEARGWVFGNGGGATQANLDQFSVYRVAMDGYEAGNPPNTPAAQLLYNDESAHRDAHGVGVTKGEKYVWVGDRSGNVIEVFRARSGRHVATIGLVSPHSADPTVDLFAASPDGKFFFMSTRGPVPLSGDPHSSTGSDPGVLVVRITKDGRGGSVVGLTRISNVGADGVERADAHGIHLRLKSRGDR